MPQQGVTRRNFVKMFDAGKTRMIGLPYGEKNYDNVLSRFHPIPERNGQTDRQNCYINIARKISFWSVSVRSCVVRSGIFSAPAQRPIPYSYPAIHAHCGPQSNFICSSLRLRQQTTACCWLLGTRRKRCIVAPRSWFYYARPNSIMVDIHHYNAVIFY